MRVHILSKELGVTSKAIVEKCKREDVEGVTNHMSTLSAGLAETIREWFSEGAQATAVEEAAPVDLEKARAKARSRRRKKSDAEQDKDKAASESDAPAKKRKASSADDRAAKKAGTDSVEPAQPETGVAVAVEEEEALRVPSVPEPSETKGEPSPTEIGVPQEPGTATAEPVEPPAAARVAAEEPPAPTAQVTEKPVEEARPAGPQNVPAPAQMKGPRVVGFAKPDPLPSRPAPRPPAAPPADIESGEPDAASGKRGRRGAVRDSEGRRARQRAHPRRSSSAVPEVGERLKEWNDRDWIERQERLQAASGRGIHARRAREKRTTGGAVPRIAPRKTKAQVKEPVIINELTAATGIGMAQLFGKFKNEHNMLINRNSVIPNELAELVMLDFGVELEIIRPKTGMEILADEYAAIERKNPAPRPPVVTMLGHVDHGKTSLLDMIRKSSVAAGEAGGITQHIGAYQVKRGELSVTFLDTPGHEAFTAMRARGANMTDVVVLVVAADDGVMPQTVEAINHAKAANVAIVVALNKIDLPGVDENKVYGQLAEHGLVPTEWGGDTDVVKTSATTGEGIDALVGHLATLADLLSLRADPTIPASGLVIEAQIKAGMGVTARLLIREGTLRRGEVVVCGPGSGKVRSMRDHRGHELEEATPGMPVEITGLDDPPNAGDRFFAVDSLQRAKQIAEELKFQRRSDTMTRLVKPKTLEDLFQQRAGGEIPELNLIVRADVQGSLDALVKSLKDIPSDQVRLNLLHAGIGGITESDVVLAQASGALIVGFNVTPETGARRLADTENVDIRLYRVIYDILEDIRKALEGLLAPEQTEEARGKAEVREIFRVSKVGTVAGCLVTEGAIARNHHLRVVRDGTIIVPTEDDVKRGRHRAIASLRRFKDDAREVRIGMECGIRIEDFDDVKPGDLLEAYEVIETARKL